MESIVNMIQESIRSEIRKLQTEMTELKNIIGKMINSLEHNSSRAVVAETASASLNMSCITPGNSRRYKRKFK